MPKHVIWQEEDESGWGGCRRERSASLSFLAQQPTRTTREISFTQPPPSNLGGWISDPSTVFRASFLHMFQPNQDNYLLKSKVVCLPLLHVNCYLLCAFCLVLKRYTFQCFIFHSESKSQDQLLSYVLEFPMLHALLPEMLPSPQSLLGTGCQYVSGYCKLMISYLSYLYVYRFLLMCSKVVGSVFYIYGKEKHCLVQRQ